MGRNPYPHSAFLWSNTPTGRSVHDIECCRMDTNDLLFRVFDDNIADALLAAFFQGLHRGRREGREELARDLKTLLGDHYT